MNTPDWGGYIPGMVTLEGSFLVNGTSNPDAIYDGNTNVIESVVLTSTGLFTVTIADWVPYIPTKLITKLIGMDRAAVPTQAGSANFVLGSWDPAARTFQIAFTGPEAADPDDTHLVAADPDDNDVISFYLRGSALAIGTD